MKISPEDPILTAYALGELDDSSRASVEAAFVNDDSLAREGATISALAGLMSKTLQGEAFSLGDERRDEILKAGRRPNVDVLVLDHRRRSRRQSLMAVVGVAAVVVLGFVGLSRFGTSGPSISGTGEAAGRSADASVISRARGAESPGGTILQTGHSMVLPLDIKSADPSFIEKALTETGELPERGQFQTAEWVNAGALVSPPLVTVANVGVYAELGPCSWDHDQALLLVNLRSTDGNASSVKATLNFNPERVKSSRLLGAVESADSAMPQSGLMKRDQTFLYKIELLAGLGRIGSIDLDVKDEVTGYLPLLDAPKGEDEISNDFAMARVFAEFAQWGKSELRDPETLQKVTATTKTLLGKITDEKSRYALDMILLSEESLKK